MVERSVCIRQVEGSMPFASNLFFSFFFFPVISCLGLGRSRANNTRGPLRVTLRHVPHFCLRNSGNPLSINRPLHRFLEKVRVKEGPCCMRAARLTARPVLHLSARRSQTIFSTRHFNSSALSPRMAHFVKPTEQVMRLSSFSRWKLSGFLCRDLELRPLPSKMEGWSRSQQKQCMG